MDSPVKVEIRDAIACVIVDNPPVNALGHAVRDGLVRSLSSVLEDDETHAVVLCCEGRTFFAGADITEFGKPSQPPILPDVIALIEDFDKPVVAAIHGTALGGGLEVALGCHYRVAVETARLGLPEVKLGLIPGAGGTVRLPRLIGPKAALEMIVSGRPISARAALANGLVDAVFGDNLVAHAMAFAAEIAHSGRR
ncbi:MAG TPA: enoyl-CoA hydratase-related protein, partial [Rhizobiaceae bacterium]|nr:enoyl-CoA hydratase-related protein [Rhizobiaceae bacterium]